MLGTLLFIALAAAPAMADDGEVVATAGLVKLHRDGKVYSAQPQAMLRPGDRLETANGGGASLLLSGGAVLDLGPGSTATLGGADGQAVELSKGELRTAVADGPLTVSVAGNKVVVARGIVRASTSPQGARAWAEAGSAEVSGASGKPVTVNGGQETTIPNGGNPTPPAAAFPEAWSLRGDTLRLATAADSSRRSKQKLAGQANDDVATTFRPSGQAPDGTEIGEDGMPRPASPTADDVQPGTDPDSINAVNPDDAESIGANTTTQQTAASAISLALGTSTAAAGAGSSGADFTDAQQDSLTTKTDPLNPAIPLAGNIHVIGAQNQFTLKDVRLSARDSFPLEREYWSIGLGASPTSQVITTFKTASDLVPQTLRIPRTDGYLVRFPQSNYGIPDPALSGVSSVVSGLSGLVGEVPLNPQVSGATPLTDSGAIFNNRATFAIGDFALQRSPDNKPQIDIRRGDQDRQIIKAPDGNDQNDQVTLNRQLQFAAVPDPKFFPELPAVSQPISNTLNPKPTYANITPLRKAGVTTLLADKLSDFSRRTGRTRFVLGGRVVDISGYRPQAANAMREIMRPTVVGVRGGATPGRATRFGHPR